MKKKLRIGVAIVLIGNSLVFQNVYANTVEQESVESETSEIEVSQDTSENEEVSSSETSEDSTSYEDSTSKNSSEEEDSSEVIEDSQTDEDAESETSQSNEDRDDSETSEEDSSQTNEENNDSESGTDSGTNADDSSEAESSNDSYIETEEDYTLTFSAVIENGVLKIEGNSSDKKVEISIIDSNGVELANKSVKVKKNSFSKNISTSDWEAGDTVEVTVTDTDGHEATRSVSIPVMAQEIDVSEYEEDLTVGDTLTLSATVLPSTATNTTITYASSDPGIATVNSAGKVTGIAAGSVTIVLSVDSIINEIPVNVYVETDSIELNQDFCTLHPGETFTIKTTISPADAEQTCTFKSTDTSVATVSEGGVVTAKEKGSASILISNGHKNVVATVIVNDSSSANSEQVLENDTDNGSENEVSSNELVQTIQSSSEDEITLQQENTIVLDAEVLNALKESEKTLIIVNDQYEMQIQGSDIKNPENSLDTAISIEQVDNGYTFNINNGNLLPGEIFITFKNIDEDMQKYLYLYNDSKQKYQYISKPKGNNQISIETQGQYLLTSEKQKQSFMDIRIIGGAIFLCVVLGVAYFLTKKKYLFW